MVGLHKPLPVVNPRCLNMENTHFLALFDHIAELSGIPAYLTILGVLLACGLGLPIPEDIILIAAGVLAGTGQISPIGAYITSYFGVLMGDSILFFIGRRYGNRVFEWPVFHRIFTPERVESAKRRIQSSARMVCFAARFLPGLRAPIYLTAGVLHVRPTTFLLQDGLAAILSVPLWIYLGQWAGENSDLAIKKAKEFNIIIFTALFVFLALWMAYRRYKKKRSVSTVSGEPSNRC